MDSKIKWQEENILRLLVNRAKHRAINKGLEFSISEEDLTIPKLCPILQIPIIVQRGRGKQPDSPSIDRINNKEGYVKGNVWIISDLANRMKQNATTEQLIRFGEWTQILKEKEKNENYYFECSHH